MEYHSAEKARLFLCLYREDLPVSFVRETGLEECEKRSAELVALTSEMELCIPDPSSEIDEDRTSEEIGQLINKFLSSLTEEKRLIFMRCYWYTDSVRSISERYGIGESKVKTTLFRARNELEDFLRKEGVTV